MDMTSEQSATPAGDAQHVHDFDAQKQLHQQIRNDPDYDDWEYGTEPRPHDAWVPRLSEGGGTEPSPEQRASA